MTNEEIQAVVVDTIKKAGEPVRFKALREAVDDATNGKHLGADRVTDYAVRQLKKRAVITLTADRRWALVPMEKR